MIVVPAGTYTLVVCFAPDGSTSDAQVTGTFTDPSSVQVSADTTRNITLPARQLFAISGALSGVSGLPSALTRTLSFTSLDNSNGGTFTLGTDWTYSGKLPNGSYTASMEALVLGGALGFEFVNVYNIGSAVVNGSSVTADFIVPNLGQLSGIASITGSSSLPEGDIDGCHRQDSTAARRVCLLRGSLHYSRIGRRRGSLSDASGRGPELRCERDCSSRKRPEPQSEPHTIR